MPRNPPTSRSPNRNRRNCPGRLPRDRQRQRAGPGPPFALWSPRYFVENFTSADALCAPSVTTTFTTCFLTPGVSATS